MISDYYSEIKSDRISLALLFHCLSSMFDGDFELPIEIRNYRINMIIQNH